MPKGVRGQEAPARRPLHEALLDEVGLDDVLDGVPRLGEGGGDGFGDDRSRDYEVLLEEKSQTIRALHQQLQQETLQKLTPVLSASQLKKFQIISEAMHAHGMHHRASGAAAATTPSPQT